MATQSRSPLILLTRPLAQSQRFAEQIAARFGPLSVLTSPVMAMRGLDVAIPKVQFSHLILTSLNGVEQAARLKFLAQFPRPKQVFCVGEQTAIAAGRSGLTVRAVGHDAVGLIAAIKAVRPNGPLLHLHGVQRRGDVAETLTNGGIETVSLAIYDQIALPLTAQARQVLGAHDPVIVPVFSPRSAKILCDQGPFSAPIHAVAMSEATGQPLRILGIARLEIAQTPDAVGMLDALGGILRHPDT